MDPLTAENWKTAEQVRKLKAEREALLKQVKDTTLTVQKVSDMVNIPGNVWSKAKMFDAELKNACHVSGTKMVTFIMDQGSKMDTTLKAMKALIGSSTKLFPATVKPSEEGETSSSYSDLTFKKFRMSRLEVETNMWKRWTKWKTSRRSRSRRFPPLRWWFPLPP